MTATGARGLTHKQTRASRFIAPSRGVRIDVEAPDPDIARTAAASLVCADGTVVTDLSAARRNLLQAAGWQVIVLTANDLHRPWLMATLVNNTLRERGER